MGSVWDLSDLDSLEPEDAEFYAYVAGMLNQTDAGIRYAKDVLDLSPLAGRLECPAYVLHGRGSPIYSMEQMEKIRKGFNNASLTLDIRDASHCCHSIGHLVRPAMADWLAHHL